MNRTWSGQHWEILKKQISAYQSHQDLEVLERLWIAVSEYVRMYPRLAFRQADEDTGSDFYLYIWERRKTLFEKYNPEHGSFSNYLSLRLRSHYLNFSLKKRKNWSWERMVYSDKEERFRDISSEGNEDDPCDETASFFPDYEKDPFSYLVLKLHYLDFFTEDDFVRLKEHTGKNYTELLEGFDRLRDEVMEKKRRRLRMDEKLGALYHDLLISQEQLNHHDNGEQGEKEKEILESRRRVLEGYHRINEFASYKGIAQILRVPETKVANTIVYQRKVMEKKLYSIDE